MPTRKPTASVYIDVYPIGVPGQVIIEVSSSGPAELTDEEIVRILKMATDTLERHT